MKETSTAMDSLTACNLYLDDQKGRYRGKDTFKQKQGFCKDLLKYIGNIKVETLSVHCVQEFLNQRAKTVSNNASNVYRKEGRCFWNWLLRQGLLPTNCINPFGLTKKFPHQTVKTGPVSWDDFLKVYRVANQTQKDFLETLLRTGARKGEIINLLITDIHLEKREYFLVTHKTKGGVEKRTRHHMSDSLYQIFKRRIENRHPDLPYVFWHKFYSHKTGDYRCDKYQSLGRFTDRLCKKAGVPKFGLHQLRHLATSILKDEGNMSISQLQKFLRHEDQKTTEIYANHLDDDTRDTTEFLNRYLDENMSVTHLETAYE